MLLQSTLLLVEIHIELCFCLCTAGVPTVQTSLLLTSLVMLAPFLLLVANVNCTTNYYSFGAAFPTDADVPGVHYVPAVLEFLLLLEYQLLLASPLLLASLLLLATLLLLRHFCF